MKIGIAIPFRGTSPERVANLEIVKKKLTEMVSPLGEAILVSVKDSGPEDKPFSRGKARNLAVAENLINGCDVSVVCDADCLPEESVLLMSIERCYQDGGLHFPFNRVRELGPGALTVLTELYGSDGGCRVVRPSEWWKLGGEPDWSEWGFEDIVMKAVYQTFSEVHRYVGWLDHMWHPRDGWVGAVASDGQHSQCLEIESYIGDKQKVAELLGRSPTTMDFTSNPSKIAG